MAEKDLRKQVDDLKKQFGADRTSTRLYEAIVLDGKSPTSRAIWRSSESLTS